MSSARNRYLSLIVILLSFSAAGFVRAHTDRAIARTNAVHSAHTVRYKDATIAHRFHQNHFKRHRSNLDGCLPVQQGTMIPVVTGSYAVAPVLHQHVPTPATPSPRGPPTA